MRPWALCPGFTETRPGGCEEELRLLLALQTPCWGGRFQAVPFPACHAGCTPWAPCSQLHLQSHSQHGVHKS